jgi:hypothetical protein
VVLNVLSTPLQIESYDAKNRTHNALFSCLSLSEFDRVGHLGMTYEICTALDKFHKGNDHMKTRLFETYQWEYDNFVQLAGETIDSMFSHLWSVMNKMRANNAWLPYDDHERTSTQVTSCSTLKGL